MKNKIIGLLFCSVCALSAEAQVDFDLTEANRLLAAANVVNGEGKTQWDNAIPVSVELTEFSFTPSELRFKKGQTYIFSVKNLGAAPHYFSAPDFFKNIALRKVQTKSSLETGVKQDVEIKAPLLTALEPLAGKLAEIYMIPMKTGTFELLCTIPGHADHGMRGTVIIED